MNKSNVFEECINMYCEKHKHIFNEIDRVYHCMRLFKITPRHSKFKLPLIMLCLPHFCSLIFALDFLTDIKCYLVFFKV